MTLPRAPVVADLPRSMTSRRSPSVAANPRPKRTSPTLYRDFYNFTHNATVVSFYLAVELQDRVKTRVSERFVEPDGAKTAFDGSGDTPDPQWISFLDDGTPTITSPDAAAQILLCRQAGLDDKQDQRGKP